MRNQKEIAEFDQALALFRDKIPLFWYSMYSGGIRAGFSKEVSLDLLKCYVMGQGAGKIEPPNSGISEDETS